MTDKNEVMLERIIAAGSYFFVVAVFVLMLQAMGSIQRRPLVQFHAWQCVCIVGVLFVLTFVLQVCHLYMLLNLVCLATLAGLLALAVSAFLGKVVRLPLIGDFAARRAGIAAAS